MAPAAYNLHAEGLERNCLPSAHPIPMTKDEAEKIDHIKANDARMQDEVNKTLRNKENNK
jgi:hypothetical protein